MWAQSIKIKYLSISVFRSAYDLPESIRRPAHLYMLDSVGKIMHVNIVRKSISYLIQLFKSFPEPRFIF